MTENIIGGFVSTAVIGLIILAYKERSLYRILSLLLLGLAWPIFICFVFWTWGLNYTYENLASFVDAPRAQHALANIDFYRIPFLKLFVGFGLLNLFLLGLQKLRRFVDKLREYSEQSNAA